MRSLKRYAPWLILISLALAVLPACFVTDLVGNVLNKEEAKPTPIVVVVPAEPEQVAPVEPAEVPATVCHVRRRPKVG